MFAKCGKLHFQSIFSSFFPASPCVSPRGVRRPKKEGRKKEWRKQLILKELQGWKEERVGRGVLLPGFLAWFGRVGNGRQSEPNQPTLFAAYLYPITGGQKDRGESEVKNSGDKEGRRRKGVFPFIHAGAIDEESPPDLRRWDLPPKKKDTSCIFPFFRGGFFHLIYGKYMKRKVRN